MPATPHSASGGCQGASSQTSCASPISSIMHYRVKIRIMSTCSIAAGDSVDHTVTITNTGNVQLRQVMVSATLTASGQAAAGALSAYSCSVNGDTPASLTNPGVTIPKVAPGTLVCTATYTFDTVTKIEAGDLAIATTATAASATTKTGTSRTVTVHQLPHLDVSADNTACASATLGTNAAGED